MEELQPKVRLDANSEYRTVYTAVESAAKQKLAAHFAANGTDSAPEGGPEAKRKKRVEGLVDDYVNNLFATAHPSLSINGVSLPPASTPQSILQASTEDEYEPYSDALRQRVQSLQASIERATVKVTTLRREAPLRAVKKIKEGLEGEKVREVKVEGGSVDFIAAGGLGRGLGERQGEVEETWEKVLGMMGGLKDDLPATTHKLIRAQDAVDYIAEKERKGK